MEAKWSEPDMLDSDRRFRLACEERDRLNARLERLLDGPLLPYFEERWSRKLRRSNSRLARLLLRRLNTRAFERTLSIVDRRSFELEKKFLEETISSDKTKRLEEMALAGPRVQPARRVSPPGRTS